MHDDDDIYEDPYWADDDLCPSLMGRAREGSFTHWTSRNVPIIVVPSWERDKFWNLYTAGGFYIGAVLNIPEFMDVPYRIHATEHRYASLAGALDAVSTGKL